MSSNYNLRTDLREAAAMVKSFESYLRGDELYGTTGGSFFNNMPRTTVGALVMRLRRLDLLRSHMRDSQSKELDRIVDQFHVVRTEWQHHYEQKMSQEVESRIDAMRHFFAECRESVSACSQAYRTEVLRRTTVQEVLVEMDSLNVTEQEALTLVRQADTSLRRFTEPTEFLWSDMLKPIYPESEYWWLYQAPPVEDVRKS